MISYCISLCKSTYVIFSYLYNPPFHHDKTTTVDVIFCLHGMLLVASQIVLILYYPRALNKVSKVWITFLAALAAGVLIFSFFSRDTASVVQLLALTMLAMNFVKNVPQIHLIVLKRSTRGFSYIAVYLDIGAQVCSFFEQVVRRLTQGAPKDAFAKSEAVMIYSGTIIQLGIDILFIFLQYYFSVQQAIDFDDLNSSDDSLVKSSKKIAEENKQLRETLDLLEN